MTIDWLKDTITGVKFYPITHEDAVIDSSGNTLSTKISVMERTTNKVTSLSSGSTHTQYPSAKCVFDAINLVSGSVISSYTGLSNLPILNTNNTTSLTASSNETITGTIKLHKVSKTGSYDDLLNKPTIPTVGTLNTNITAAQATATSESLSGTIKLHKVAKTGTYSDLIGTPTIPSPPGTLSTSATTALATASTEALSSAINLHKIAKTGTYSDLIGTPTIPTVGTLNTNVSTAQATATSESLSSTIKLHKVAKTGTYTDLLNRPTLGTAASKPEEYFAGSGHTHAVTITGTSENSQILLQPNGTYDLTVGKSSFTFTTPQDTHYTAIPVVGVQTATTNATSDVADPYVNIIENSAKSGGIRISGVGGTTVKAKNGVITISSNVTPPSALSSTYAAATDNSSPVSGDSFETSISKLHGLANSTSAALNGKEDKSNKITSISSGSTDTQYPSAKCLYDILSDMVAHENTQSTASTPDYDPQTQSVSILEQTLTPEQQAQARENIGVDELIGDIEDVLDEILGSGTTKSQKKLEVIEASGTTLNSEENSYYHFDDVITTLAITLPSVGDTSHINQVIFNFTTGSNPLVSFEASPISGIRPSIYANEGFSIDANTTYEINAIYNGNTWVLAAIRIDATDISS